MISGPTSVRVDKPWGHEEWLAVFPDRYVVKLISVRAGERLSLQRHRQKHETQFYVHGRALIEHGRDLGAMEEDEISGTGAVCSATAITFEPGVWHRISAVTDVTMLEVQTAHPGWSHDIERRDDAYGREGTTAPSIA